MKNPMTELLELVNDNPELEVIVKGDTDYADMEEMDLENMEQGLGSRIDRYCYYNEIVYVKSDGLEKLQESMIDEIEKRYEGRKIVNFLDKIEKELDKIEWKKGIIITI